MRQNHYYPYGLKHQNYNVDKLDYVEGENGYVLASESALQYKYKFNGQEWQEELGLNTTAMDFRQYDNAIGRFVSVDALAEIGFSVTPYHFANNNPVYFNDPTGLTSGTPANQWLQDFDGVWHHVDGSNFTEVWNSESSDSSTAFPVLQFLNLSFGGSAGNVSISGGQQNPLQRFIEKAITLQQWADRYSEMDYFDIISEEPWRKDGMPGGPTFRYVINPIDGNVMDMRHVTIVGYGTGEIVGNFIEHIQYMSGRHDTAYDPQDYYSNRMGDYFHQMRNMGTWSSNSWAYDFQRFILTQYRGLQQSIIPK